MVKQREEESFDEVFLLIDELTRIRESEWFQKVGQLSRNVHNTIVETGYIFIN